MPQPDLRALDLAMLRAFDALMRERSVSRAAGRLFLSQPAVSAQLGRLRHTFGDALFTRTAHGVEPTAQALAMAPQVEQVLADIAALLQGEQAFDPARSDRVFRIAGSDHMSGQVLPALGRVLDGCGSGIRIVWEPPGAGLVEERLLRGELDLAVVARIRPPRELRTATLYEDRYVYVLRAGHPRAAEPVTVAMFCEIPQTFLGYGSSVLDDRIDETLDRLGQRRRAQVVVSSIAQIVHQLEHGDHGAVLGERVARLFGTRLLARPVPLELPSYQALLCRAPRSDKDAGVLWLWREIERIFGIAAAP